MKFANRKRSFILFMCIFSFAKLFSSIYYSKRSLIHVNPKPLHYSKVLRQADLLLLKVLQDEGNNPRKTGRQIFRYLQEDEIIRRTRDCSNYFSTQITVLAASKEFQPLSARLAFSHTIHHQVGIFEMFLSVAYHPWNSHCIFVDPKASSKVVEAVQGIVHCYRQKFLMNCKNCGSLIISNNTFPLYWGHVSVLEADLACLRQLLESNEEWRFYFNTAGTELPLQPIQDISQNLHELNQSVIQSHLLPESDHYRLWNQFKLKKSRRGNKIEFRYTGKKRVPSPFSFSIMKGIRYVVLDRPMSKFVTSSNISSSLLSWIQDMPNGDESFYSTLATLDIHSDVLSQNLTKDTLFGRCPRLIFWSDKQCFGKIIRDVCHFGLKDVERLQDSPCFICNKFDLAVSPSAVLKHWLHVVNQTSTSLWEKLILNGAS